MSNYNAAGAFFKTELGMALMNELIEIKDIVYAQTPLYKVTTFGIIPDCISPDGYDWLKHEIEVIASHKALAKGEPTDENDCRSACTGLCACCC